MTKKSFIKKYGCDEDYGILLKDGRLVKGFFTCLRVDDDDVPNGMYKYDLREDDNDLSLPATIEEHVYINHYGTFITKERIDFNGKDCLEIDNSDIDYEVFED